MKLTGLTTDKKIGIALGSGSSRGWAHIGVLEELATIGIEPVIVTGCSAGSIVGASYASGKLEELKRWVLSLTRLDVAKFLDINFTRKGFVNIDKLVEFFDRYVVEKERLIEDLPKPYSAVATNLENGRETWFQKGRVIDAILASIALPGLFPPYHLNNQWFVDGGLVNPVPVSLCRAMNADIVIAVNLNGDIVGKHFVKNLDASEKLLGRFDFLPSSLREWSKNFFPNLSGRTYQPGLFDTIAGSINIAQDRITRSRMAGDPPDIMLSPKLSHIGLMEFDRGAEAIEEGRACVRRMLPEIEYVLKKLA